MKNLRVPVAGFLIVLLAGGCAPPVRVRLPEPLVLTKPEGDAGTQTVLSAGTRGATTLVRSATPMPPDTGPAASGLHEDEGIPPVKGKPIDVKDPLSARLRQLADTAGPDADQLAASLLTVTEVFGTDLPTSAPFRDTVTNHLKSLLELGSAETVRRVG